MRKSLAERRAIMAEWYALQSEKHKPNQDDFAARFNITSKTLRSWMQDPALLNRHGQVLPEPKKLSKITNPEVLAAMEDSPDGFERFFNRYSGMTLQPHSKSFVAAAWGEDSVVINVPPNHAKSTIFSVWLPLWHICRDRNVQVIVLSQTDILAKIMCLAMIQQMEENTLLIKDFGRFKPENVQAGMWSPGEGQIRVAGSNIKIGWTLVSRGGGQQIQGFRADRIITDDLVDPKRNVETKDVRDKLFDWYQGIVDSRLNPGGIETVVGTRWHPDDLYGRLTAIKHDNGDPMYRHINFPALRDPHTGEPSLEDDALPLWPHPVELNESDPCKGRMCRRCRSRKFLDWKRTKIGVHSFMQTFQQIPVPPGSAWVSPEAWEGCLDKERPFGTPTEPPEGYVRVLSIDPTAGGPGFAAWIVMDLPKWGEDFEASLVFWNRETYFGRPKLLAECKRIFKELAPVHFCIIEFNTPSYALKEDPDLKALCAQYNVLLQPHTTQASNKSSEIGVNTLSVDFEAGRIRIPAAPGHDNGKYLAPFKNEILTMPVGETTDFFMALWFAKAQRKALRRWTVAQEYSNDWNLPAHLRGVRW